ncbi:MAG: hypothetical protein JSS81_09640 [Acidobacteria bacterium]|nr:hypothetical protein [Acidobacteriota bacterium]
MLNLIDVQTIIFKSLAHMTGGNPSYVRNKKLAQMGIISQPRFNGFVNDIYHGVAYYHHSLPNDAFDNINTSSTIADVENVVSTATPAPGGGNL